MIHLILLAKNFLNYELFSIRDKKIFLFDVVEVIIIVGCAFLLLKWIKRILQRSYRKQTITVGQQYAYYQLSKYIITAITFLLTLTSLKQNLASIWIGSAALLVGVGIGIQQLFNDLVSGFLLLFEDTVRVGDIVEVDGMVSRVVEIGVRTSKVKNRDGIVVVIPNSKIVSNSVINWTTESRMTRFKVNVGVAYGSDPILVRDILLKCASGHKEVSNSPKPICRFTNFGDSSLDFELLFWSKNNFRIEDVKSDLRFMIHDALKANHITIPFPQRDLHIKSDFRTDRKEGAETA
ncbi:MAG: mechanosensitive ion channel [Bacteroidetes bacterium]|nr:mechanosensitive ion channel [Bacteroidota bacterium]